MPPAEMEAKSTADRRLTIFTLGETAGRLLTIGPDETLPFLLEKASAKLGITARSAYDRYNQLVVPV